MFWLLPLLILLFGFVLRYAKLIERWRFERALRAKLNFLDCTNGELTPEFKLQLLNWYREDRRNRSAAIQVTFEHHELAKLNIYHIGPTNTECGMDLKYYRYGEHVGYSIPEARIREYYNYLGDYPYGWTFAFLPLVSRGEESLNVAIRHWHETGDDSFVNRHFIRKLRPEYETQALSLFPPTEKTALIHSALLAKRVTVLLPEIIKCASESEALNLLPRFKRFTNISEWILFLEWLRYARRRKWNCLSEHLIRNVLLESTFYNLSYIWDEMEFINDIRHHGDPMRIRDLFNRSITVDNLENMALTANLRWVEALSLVFDPYDIFQFNLSPEARNCLSLMMHLSPHIRSLSTKGGMPVTKRSFGFIRWAFKAIEAVYPDNNIAQRKLTTYLLENVIWGRYTGDILLPYRGISWSILGLYFIDLADFGDNRILSLLFH